MKHLGIFLMFIVAFATFAIGGAHAADTIGVSSEISDLLNMGMTAGAGFTFLMGEIKLTNLDADESVFFSRELEHVKSQSYDVEYPELKARSLIPVSNEAGPGAESITYEQYDQVGTAKLLASYAEDLPRADVKGKEFTSPVRGLADSYGYSIQEIRAAKLAGKPLAQRRADAAKRAIMELDNRIAFFGDSKSGLKGFFAHANVPAFTITADGTGATTTWSTKTALLIHRDLSDFSNSIVEQTNGVEIPDTLLVPLVSYNLIKNKPIGDNADKSVLKYFLENNEYVKSVQWVNELKTAGSGGVKRMMVYKKDPSKVTLEIPQDFEQFEPQLKGLTYEVPCHLRTGGVIFYKPLSASYADGI